MKNIPGVLHTADLFELNPSFPQGVNCKILSRRISSDFNGLAQYLGAHLIEKRPDTGSLLTDIDRATLRFLAKDLKGGPRKAAAAILGDMQGLSQSFPDAALRVVARYGRDSTETAPHAAQADYALSICYNGPTTAIIDRNDIYAERLGATYAVRRGTERHHVRPGDTVIMAGALTSDPAGPCIHAEPQPDKNGPPRLILTARGIRNDERGYVYRPRDPLPFTPDARICGQYVQCQSPGDLKRLKDACEKMRAIDAQGTPMSRAQMDKISKISREIEPCLARTRICNDQGREVRRFRVTRKNDEMAVILDMGCPYNPGSRAPTTGF